VDYDPTQYRGSAPHYLAGRPPYSAELGAVLAGELGLDGTVHLLDVGCGPGVLAVQLAALVERVTALDPDADMLEQARAHAASSGVARIEFIHARAEDIADLGLPPTRMVSLRANPVAAVRTRSKSWRAQLGLDGLRRAEGASADGAAAVLGF
jgi:SAM-dependent methyltransferase